VTCSPPQAARRIATKGAVRACPVRLLKLKIFGLSRHIGILGTERRCGERNRRYWVASLATPTIINRAEVMLNERLGIIETILPASEGTIFTAAPNWVS
jgi:hypothetical protein